MDSGIEPFWRGVLASIVAAIIVAIATKAWTMYSAKARGSLEKRKEGLARLRSKMLSSDSVLRVEGYFVALFTLLKYMFGGTILLVAAWSLSFFDTLASLTIAALSLLVYYFGLRWLADVQRPPAGKSTDAEGHDLVIHYAKYGKGEKYADVSKEISRHMLNGKIQMHAGNQIAGDPCPKIGKELWVHYSYNGLPHTRIVPEGSLLSLP